MGATRNRTRYQSNERSTKRVAVENRRYPRRGSPVGVKIWARNWLNGTNQKFYFGPTTSGCYRLMPTHANAAGTCLDVSGVSTADGALVQLWQWLDGNNQQWTFQAP